MEMFFFSFENCERIVTKNSLANSRISTHLLSDIYIRVKKKIF